MANSSSKADTIEIGRETRAKCLMKGKEHSVNGDGDDLTPEDLAGLTGVDIKFTMVPTTFRGPWLSHKVTQNGPRLRCCWGLGPRHGLIHLQFKAAEAWW
ncbi:hypothetical protein E2562_023400 [Oryza meyeriana var. granulata]|uniref:Uncharacterized protein n=1 Tax=Oryza meyeriana var. granulata TaxID=110450 RepID=A0A6G1E0M7_9ORYZ|nr:hypothetical protein E2562_023400 [Oryza meyeriana var. granulata]